MNGRLDHYFVSPRAKLVFCLLRNKHGILDHELGITHTHYLDGRVAAKWKDEMLDLLDLSDGIEPAACVLVEAKLNVEIAYNRMIGIA